MCGSMEDESLLGGGAPVLGLGGGVWSHQTEERPAELELGPVVWLHRSGEPEAEWGEALGEGGQ